jgi:hypothetical protein
MLVGRVSNGDDWKIADLAVRMQIGKIGTYRVVSRNLCAPDCMTLAETRAVNSSG